MVVGHFCHPTKLESTVPSITAQAPRRTSRRPRFWIEVRDRAELRAVEFVLKETGLMRSELLRRFSLNQIVEKYLAKGGK